MSGIRKKPSLGLTLDSSDSFPQVFTGSENITREKIYELLNSTNDICKEFGNRLNTIYNDTSYEICDSNIVGDVVYGSGAFASVHSHKTYDNIVIKISKMLHNTLDKSRHCAETNALNELVTYFLKTPEIVEKIKSIFSKIPKNINQIFEFKQCRLNPDDLPVNQYQLKKINGKLLSEMIIDDNIELLKIYFQLLYVVGICNLNGLFHNDLTVANIMVENNKSDILLNSMKFSIDGNNFMVTMNIKDAYIPLLIDFEIGYINNDDNVYPYEMSRVCEIFCEYSEIKSIVDNIKKICIRNVFDMNQLIRRSPMSIDKFAIENGYKLKYVDIIKIYHTLDKYVKLFDRFSGIDIRIYRNDIDITNENIDEIIDQILKPASDIMDGTEVALSGPHAVSHASYGIGLYGGNKMKRKYDKYMQKTINIINYINNL